MPKTGHFYPPIKKCISLHQTHRDVIRIFMDVRTPVTYTCGKEAWKLPQSSDYIPRESLSYISKATMIMKNAFYNKGCFCRFSLVRTFFLEDITAVTLLPKQHLLKFHQNQVRNELGAPSEATLCSRLVKVICCITLPAPVALISDFHVRSFWCGCSSLSFERCLFNRCLFLMLWMFH